MILNDFWQKNKHLARPFNWLNGLSYSEKFVICLGAGPWRFNRRKKIQQLALSFLDKRDLSEIDVKEIKEIFPLQWQNNYLLKAHMFLNNEKISFDDLCESLKVNNEFYFAQNKLKEIFDVKKLPKVLSLFCRDGLNVPAFPIDRHVKRKLYELELPTNEEEIMQICLEQDLDPTLVALCFVRSSSNMDNPDWSL